MKFGLFGGGTERDLADWKRVQDSAIPRGFHEMKISILKKTLGLKGTTLQQSADSSSSGPYTHGYPPTTDVHVQCDSDAPNLKLTR